MIQLTRSLAPLVLHSNTGDQLRLCHPEPTHGILYTVLIPSLDVAQCIEQTRFDRVLDKTRMEPVVIAQEDVNWFEIGGKVNLMSARGLAVRTRRKRTPRILPLKYDSVSVWTSA